MIKPNLYMFQWISDLGGADTRLKELIVLLKNDFNITCIPNDEFRLKEKENTDFLDSHGIKYSMMADLPTKLEGFAYANCNFRIFSEKHRIDFINKSGLKFLWSNDMMWTDKEELAAISAGKVDCVLFTSPFHQSVLENSILRANVSQKMAILENFFDSSTWPYVKRQKRDFVACGKVSRPDTMKFSEDFPVFYESVTQGMPVHFHVMGWSDELKEKYNWFNFSPDKWKLLNANSIPTQNWFSFLDIFLYNCNFRFIENQSRAIIEAQLTGCPVVAPDKWNFPNMIWDQRTGFLWKNSSELRDILKDLMDYDFRNKYGKLASECTRDLWCDVGAAKRKWYKVLDYVLN
jgi:glycosyltransferase involved in cell wall biosynthesis